MNMFSGYYSPEELNKFNFKKCGKNNLVSKLCVIYHPENIILGNNNKIDDFVMLSPPTNGLIELKDNITIADYCKIGNGKYGNIIIGNNSALAPRVTILNSSDNYNTVKGVGASTSLFSDIKIGDNVIIGTNSTIVFNSIIGDNTRIGAHSLVKTTLKGNNLYAGIPVKIIRKLS